MSGPLHGRVAVVTGAGRGIGAAIAAGYARAGAGVGLVARSAAQLEAVADDIAAAGGRAEVATADVGDADGLASAFDAVAHALGGIDLVVANAGTQPPDRPVAEADPDHWRHALETNVVGVAATIRAAVPHLRARGGGRIVTLGSGLGRHGLPGLGAYASSKAALTRLTQVAAAELAAEDISVNELVPGPVDTALSSGPAQGTSVAATFAQEWRKRPEDVVPLALYLATQPPPGPTGQTFSLLRR